jgi:membrane associated rhomboid family serine protease
MTGSEWPDVRTRVIMLSSRPIVSTEDTEAGLPGSPDVTDFLKPMPRRPIPASLLGKEPTAAALILSSIIVIGLTVLDWSTPLTSFGVAAHDLYRDGRIDLLLLSVFSHANLGHLLSNLIGFLGFGYLLKRHFGWIAFPLIPITVGLLTASLTVLTMQPQVKLIGASGMVFAMGGLHATLYLLLETRYVVSTRLLRVAGVLLILFFPQEYAPNTSYMAHGIGMGLGIVAGLIFAPHLRHDQASEPPLFNRQNGPCRCMSSA